MRKKARKNKAKKVIVFLVRLTMLVCSVLLFSYLIEQYLFTFNY